jgi:hypothetical protein
MDDEPASGSNTRRTKIERLLAEYDMAGFGAELERYWTGEAAEEYSLRELADLFNRRLLRTAMREANMAAIDGEVANYYRLLTDDDVSAGQRTEARSRLERAGIDVDDLETDFVSHQAVHTYLTERRGAVHQPATPEERIENNVATLRRLENRVETVAENVVSSSRDAGLLDVDEFDVLVSVTVTCQACGTQYPATELLERGHCDCRDA